VTTIPQRQPYQKPALTFEQQLHTLEQRGLKVHEPDLALKRLSNVSYFRLSAYAYPFRLRDPATHLVGSDFEQGASFEKVLELYDFDTRLRELVLCAIERIEVAVRTQLTYHLALKYGAFGYAEAANFHPKFIHQQWLESLYVEVERSKDKFIDHYKTKYDGFPKIPIWMLTEVMSMGSLSMAYSGLRNDQKLSIEDKKVIADHFHVPHKRLADWLHTLTYVRNVCAHHSRLWNRELAIRPDSAKTVEWQAPLTPRSDRIFYVLLIIRHMLQPIGGAKQWTEQITHLLEPIASSARWRAAMGMPEEWRNHPLWVMTKQGD
jgi:abortive infection bacteriophage resistance protein